MSKDLSAFRRTFAVGTLWAIAMGALLVTAPTASGQEGGVSPGRGSAFAQGVKVDPRSGRLSFGITYGIALAGHQNTVAIGEARSVDLGVIGTTLAGEGCDGGDPTLPSEDQPQPLVVRSSEEGAAEGRTETEYQVEKQASASDSPLATAVATTAASGEPGVIEIGSSVSRTTSGIVDGARVATATTDVGSVTIGGTVVLKGLHWEARYQTAPTEESSGAFTIEGIEVAGQSIPISEDNPLGPLGAANEVLEPLGFRIDPPTVRNEAGIQFVDPMRISIVPSETREGILGPVFNALSPIRESVFDAIIEADCGNASYITILDIVLNSITGAGSLNIELGGVTATSAEIARTSFLPGLPSAPSLTPTPTTPAPTAGSPSLGSTSSGSTGSGASGGTATTPTTVGGTTTPTTAAPSDEVAIGDVTPVSGSRGGALAGVGLAGLLLLGALAEGDRRRIQRANRLITMEA